ncbi:MAG: arsenite methyltransferase [Actinomycetia bacterium]|nr:arsenite methyltransferase [Actinomycetes bacterium]MCP3910756.1 arsenite methyltransferase [Actinomycetes bacterium]MCP4084483.1 arsenite methyltransferase [Actinomycetes bacterium]
MVNHTDEEQLREKVSERYGQIARRVIEDSPRGTSCCGPDNPITRDLYTEGETAELPGAAAQASLGCGNPTALTELREGETVLDLGSGGGIDVLLSARRVGPTGKAYGLDMTDDMLELARQNQSDAGVENVEFLKGHIEDIPLPDDSVDVIISNCVINLSSDKGQVLREAFRVLRPGGRFAVSDVVVRGTLDPKIRSSVEAWIGCVAGALDEDDYRMLLTQAGFTDIEVQPTRVYELADAEQVLAANGIDLDEVASAEGQVMSAFVRATKAEAREPRRPGVD